MYIYEEHLDKFPLKKASLQVNLVFMNV